MLTADLIRSRIVGDEILPRYITRHQSPTYLEVGRVLLHLFQIHKGKQYSELTKSLEDLEGKRTDYKIFRGLAKLLEDEAEFKPAKEIDYADFRNTVFFHAQSSYPLVSKQDLLHKTTREQVLANISKNLGVPSEEIDSILYGDLPENQILTSFKSDFSPETLLKRYNLALAQGILYRAIRMRIKLHGDYRIVFQYIKLAHLIHWIQPLSSGGFEITLNGPASLFRNTQRYGIRMANFLPGLILAKNWIMNADINTPEGPKQFRLKSDCGLTSHYTSVPPFDSQIEENFYQKFCRKNRDWQIQREGEIIDLGDTVFIPDFTFHHNDGRTASMEIIGFWTPEYLKKKTEKIRRAGRQNLILAVNSQLNCSRDDFKEEIIFYRTGIRIGDVLKKLEEVSMPPESEGF